jgi:hypothetical protein
VNIDQVTEKFGGQPKDWRQHKNGGGWVHQDATVAEAAVVGRDAIIRGGAILGGEIRGGTIRGGTILGGIIRGGFICGGVIRGGTFFTSPCQATRSDGYTFTAKVVDGELRLWAGCRDFSWDEAVSHWGNPEHTHRKESMRIIRFLRDQAKAEWARDKKRGVA